MNFSKRSERRHHQKKKLIFFILFIKLIITNISEFSAENVGDNLNLPCLITYEY